jgi:tetratricopeptide (TPR) repeat protein
MRVRTFVNVIALVSIASCGQLQCDQQKQKAIENMNAGIEAMKNGQSEDAIKKLEMAKSLDPTNDKIAFNLGQVYLQKISGRYSKLTDAECVVNADCKKDWESAAAAFEAAAKADPKQEMYFYRQGEALYRAGNLQPALTALTEAVKLNKRLFKAHWYIGRIYMLMDQPKDAAAAWTQAIMLNPSFGKPFIDLGRLYEKWDMFPEAAKVLEQGGQFAKAAEVEDRTNIFYELGMTYDAMAASSTPPSAQYYDKAIDAYLKAIKEKADNNDAVFQLGFTYGNKFLVSKADADKANAKKYLDAYIKSVGTGEASAAQVELANARMLKLVTE